MAENDDQEKTEAATPRKISDAREKGQVALSQDVVAALSLIVAAVVLVLSGASLATEAGTMIRESAASLTELGLAEITIEGWSGVAVSGARPMALPLLLAVTAMLAASLFAGYAQVGFQVTPKALEWNPSRLSPTSGFKKIFGIRGVARTVQASVKIMLVGGVACWVAWAAVPELSLLAGAPLHQALTGVGAVLLRICGASIGVFAALAFFDALYQRWQHGKDLMMSRQEVRQEIKNNDGDPQVRARIREIQRRIARQRMMAAVPEATVIITNPTHVAVALRWQGEEEPGKPSAMSAPVVVAKGVDLVAQRIKEVARAHSVPLHEDVPLARALHAQCEIGDEIPAELYQAVAAVLAQVWNLQGAPRAEA